jgi:hypothetical protein
MGQWPPPARPQAPAQPRALAAVVDFLQPVDGGGKAGLAGFELQREVEGVMAGLVQVPAVEPERLLLGHVRKRYEQP